MSETVKGGSNLSPHDYFRHLAVATRDT